ncbi:MAG: YggS family pyridoxal phosphate-dependent enzyme [Bacteroidota bacterium]
MTFADRLDAVRSQIADACAAAGRDPDEITLVAVSKTHPLDVLREALDAGVRDLGENRVSEFVEKAEALGDTPTWHFIGSLQRNKARDVARHADLFHALDSDRLAKELNKRASGEGRVLRCLVQVNISGEESKHGVEPADADAFFDRLSAFDHLDIVGLMGMAAPAPPAALDRLVRPQFARLREIAERTTWDNSPILSMGMSGDYPAAIAEGATHIRVGSALFGSRR